MPENVEPVYLVDAYSEPAVLRIQGRATYLNCAPVKKFFEQMAEEAKRAVVVDFLNCKGMDSTFLGTLAGAALAFGDNEPPGEIILVRLNERNLELIHNLGLHRILTVDDVQTVSDSTVKTDALESSAADAKSILRAHEVLVEADKGNIKKFQDVLNFLRLQAGEDDYEESC